MDEIEHSVLHVGLGVDCSGSMRKHVATIPKVIDGLTAHLAHQSKVNNQEVRLSVLLFNHKWRYWVWEMDVLRVPSMVGRYAADGGTALMDATMALLQNMETVPQLGGRHDFLHYILTDGYDEDSHLVTHTVLRTKLQALPSNVTAGALVPDFSAVATAKNCGFPAGNVATWDASASDGFERAMEKITTSATKVMRMTSTGTARGTKHLFAPDPSKINDAAVEALGMTPVKPTTYDLIPIGNVPEKTRMIDYFAANGLPWRLGQNFYQLQKDELIAADKELALVKTSNSSQVVYIGPEIRTLLNLPDDKKVRVAPGLVPGWKVYVQSKSADRHVQSGGLLIRKA